MCILAGNVALELETLEGEGTEEPPASSLAARARAAQGIAPSLMLCVYYSHVVLNAYGSGTELCFYNSSAHARVLTDIAFFEYGNGSLPHIHLQVYYLKS